MAGQGSSGLFKAEGWGSGVGKTFGLPTLTFTNACLSRERLWSQTVPLLQLLCCVTLGKLLRLSVPGFPCLYRFPVVAIKNDHKRDGLQQHKFILSLLWRPEV